MTDRPQVNIRLDRELLGELDELARTERVDRSEIARRILDSGLRTVRLEVALRDYREGRVSAWKAASMARISLYEMLDRIHEVGIPYDLDPDVLRSIDRLGGGPPAGALPNAVATREEAAFYGSGAGEQESGIAELRDQFRPDHVRSLFVGESSPAGGTHFYRANSNLFHATQAAFVRAFGDVVPNGPAFLHFFRDHGCWLVDLADRPVNRLPGRPRKEAVDSGVDRLAELISDTRPDRIIVVKASIASAVRVAANRAAFVGPLTELPFPVRQWRTVYIERLASEVAAGAKHKQH